MSKNVCLKCNTEYDGNFCPKCGQMARFSETCYICGTFFCGDYCPTCGSLKKDIKKCPNCGIVALLSDNVCKKCGYRFNPEIKNYQEEKNEKTFKLKRYYLILGIVVIVMSVLAIVVSESILHNKFSNNTVEKFVYGEQIEKVIATLGDPFIDEENYLLYKKNLKTINIDTTTDENGKRIIKNIIFNVDGTGNKEVISTIIVTGSINEDGDNADKIIVIKHYYKDGSYQLTTIPKEVLEGSLLVEDNKIKLTWEDGLGRYTLEVPVENK